MSSTFSFRRFSLHIFEPLYTRESFLKAVEHTSYAFQPAAMDAMKDKAPAQGELLGLHTQNPDDWPKDEEASTMRWPFFTE